MMLEPHPEEHRIRDAFPDDALHRLEKDGRKRRPCKPPSFETQAEREELPKSMSSVASIGQLRSRSPGS